MQLPLALTRHVTAVKGLRGAALASLGLLVAAGAAALVPVGTAQAMPMAAIQVPAAETEPLLVRDGCGRGMRFSNSRQRCVPDGDGGFRGDGDFRRGPPPRAFDDGFRRGPPPRAFDDGFRRGPPPRAFESGCPRGQRFSNSRQACVWN